MNSSFFCQFLFFDENRKNAKQDTTRTKFMIFSAALNKVFVFCSRKTFSLHCRVIFSGFTSFFSFSRFEQFRYCHGLTQNRQWQKKVLDLLEINATTTITSSLGHSSRIRKQTKHKYIIHIQLLDVFVGHLY